MDAQVVVDALARCDVELLTPERLELLALIWPNDEETAALRTYVSNGSVKSLRGAEFFLASLISLPRATNRLLLATTFATSDEKIGAIRDALATESTACMAVMKCDPLKDVLELVVEVSNVLNCTAGPRRVVGPEGIKLSTLNKLAHFKASKRNPGVAPTLLHFIAGLAKKHKPRAAESR